MMQNKFSGRAFALLATWVTTGALMAATGAPPEDLESARATLARWVETQEIISREKKEWQQAKEMLVSRTEIVKKEIAQIEEKLTSGRTVESDASKARAQAVADIEALRSVTTDLGAQVAGIEAQARRLCTALPDTLREKIQPLYDRMPREGAVSRVSLAERFQNVLGILNEMGKFNSEINVVSEIRPLSDGKPSEVRTIYVGLGQAYFVSAGGEAGIGRPTEDGWKWQPANALAIDINQALEVLQNKSKPKFVPLPVEIQ